MHFVMKIKNQLHWFFNKNILLHIWHCNTLHSTYCRSSLLALTLALAFWAFPSLARRWHLTLSNTVCSIQSDFQVCCAVTWRHLLRRFCWQAAHQGTSWWRSEVISAAAWWRLVRRAGTSKLHWMKVWSWLCCHLGAPAVPVWWAPCLRLGNDTFPRCCGFWSQIRPHPEVNDADPERGGQTGQTAAEMTSTTAPALAHITIENLHVRPFVFFLSTQQISR